VSKVAYLGKYGIVPFFKKKLTDSVKASSQYVVLFDESLNDTTDFYCFTWITNDLMSTICFFHQCRIDEYTKVYISL